MDRNHYHIFGDVWGIFICRVHHGARTHSRMSSPKRMMLQQQAAWSAPENRTRHTRQHCDFCLLPCCNMLQYAQVLFPMFPMFPSSLLMPGFGCLLNRHGDIDSGWAGQERIASANTSQAWCLATARNTGLFTGHSMAQRESWSSESLEDFAWAPECHDASDGSRPSRLSARLRSWFLGGTWWNMVEHTHRKNFQLD